MNQVIRKIYGFLREKCRNPDIKAIFFAAAVMLAAVSRILSNVGNGLEDSYFIERGKAG